MGPKRMLTAAGVRSKQVLKLFSAQSTLASDTGGSVHLGCPVKGSRVRDIMGRLRKSSSRGQDSQLTNYSV